MITKLDMRKLMMGLVLGVILLGTVGVGSANAQYQYLPTPHFYCDGRALNPEDSSKECRVGQEVVAVTRQNLLDPNDTPVPVDWDPDWHLEYVDGKPVDTFAPEQFDTTTFRYVYAVPGAYTIAFRTDDGRRGTTGVNIVDSSILTREPAFNVTGTGYKAEGEDGSCTITRKLYYRAYRDHSYRYGLKLSYRSKHRKQVSGSKRYRRIVRKGRVAAVQQPWIADTASEQIRIKQFDLSFDANRKIRLLINRHARAILTLRERVVDANGTLYYKSSKRFFNLEKCKFGRKVGATTQSKTRSTNRLSRR